MAFTLAMLGFLVLADALIITQQSRAIHAEMQHHTDHEVDLFAKLVADSLTRNDYAAVEQAAISWASEQENILKLKIVTSNGFDLVNYSRSKDVRSQDSYKRKISYGDDHSIKIDIVKDTSGISSTLTNLVIQLVIISIILVALLGLIIQRIALRPLQREINLHRKTEESLRHSIVELESMNYSLSHDLRTPLRAITGFSQTLRDDAGSRLSAEERQSLERIENAGKSMAELIDDILELSRMSSARMSRSSIDVTKLARQCLENLLSKYHANEIVWDIKEGMTASADRRFVIVLLENLLDNAIKYTTRTESPVIKIGSLKKEGDTVFYVLDNGAGFDMKFADKLFEPFQRLHQDQGYTGTGIGLAIATRVVQRHGGRIWAESQPGMGSTFYFTLPNE
ncbi:MAG: GHKL domain-containing protein [Acidiferrobacterales bacterium]|nr:GHKL domain-containing protein [Acidiferrobacterales bacterium]